MDHAAHPTRSVRCARGGSAEHLTDDEQRRQRALDRSWTAAQASLSDEDLVADVRARIERLRMSDAPRLSRGEFLAQTDIDD